MYMYDVCYVFVVEAYPIVVTRIILNLEGQNHLYGYTHAKSHNC